MLTVPHEFYTPDDADYLPTGNLDHCVLAVFRLKHFYSLIKNILYCMLRVFFIYKKLSKIPSCLVKYIREEEGKPLKNTVWLPKPKRKLRSSPFLKIFDDIMMVKISFLSN